MAADNSQCNFPRRTRLWTRNTARQARRPGLIYVEGGVNKAFTTIFSFSSPSCSMIFFTLRGSLRYTHSPHPTPTSSVVNSPIFFTHHFFSTKTNSTVRSPSPSETHLERQHNSHLRIFLSETVFLSMQVYLLSAHLRPSVDGSVVASNDRTLVFSHDLHVPPFGRTFRTPWPDLAVFVVVSVGVGEG